MRSSKPCSIWSWPRSWTKRLFSCRLDVESWVVKKSDKKEDCELVRIIRDWHEVAGFEFGQQHLSRGHAHSQNTRDEREKEKLHLSGLSWVCPTIDHQQSELMREDHLLVLIRVFVHAECKIESRNESTKISSTINLLPSGKATYRLHAILVGRWRRRVSGEESLGPWLSFHA